MIDYTIYDGNEIGTGLFIGHYALIRGGNKIGEKVRIGSYTEIAHDCTIGNGVRIHSQCFICENSVLEDGAWLGPRVCLINDDYPNSGGKSVKRAPIIKRGARIGSSSVILPGVTVGEFALIGAGSIVTKDVPAGEVWCGNPAKFLKFVSAIGAYNS